MSKGFLKDWLADKNTGISIPVAKPNRGPDVVVATKAEAAELREARIMPSPFTIVEEAPLSGPRNLDHAEATVFMEDGVAAEFDILTPEQKSQLQFFHRHGIFEHHHQARAALAAHEQTGDVNQLDQAIALLLHLRKLQHPDE